MYHDAYKHRQRMSQMKNLHLKTVIMVCLVGISLSGCQTVQQLKFPDVLSGKKSSSEKSQVHQSKQTQASSSNLPLAQIFKLQPDLMNSIQQSSIQQVFNRNENPTAAQVTVIQSGLMDDSVSAIRTIYQFKKNEKQWFVVNVEKSYQCARGDSNKGFQTALCP